VVLIQRAVLLDGIRTDIRVDERIVEVGDLAPQKGEQGCSTPRAKRSSLACTTIMSTCARPQPP
jgi:hypothetical protein